MVCLGAGGCSAAYLTVTAPTLLDRIQTLWSNPTGQFWILSVLVLVPTIVLTRRQWRRQAIPSTIGVLGGAAILIALIHFAIGSFAPPTGLWVNREVLPSVLASLGSSLIAFAGLAWSLQMDQERNRRARLSASISEVTRAIDHCNQLARRGWQILYDGLRPLAEPLLRRREEEGNACLWFEILEQNPQSSPSSVTMVPATHTAVWSALRAAEEWHSRLVERIESLATDRARELRQSNNAWLDEYERLRPDLAGLSDVLPLDLMPFVDDLELIRDILRVSEHHDATEGEGPALLIAFAIALEGLKKMLQTKDIADPEGMLEAATARLPETPSGSEKVEPDDGSEGIGPEDMLARLLRPSEKMPSSLVIDVLERAERNDVLGSDIRKIVTGMLTPPTKAGSRSFTRDRHWTDAVRPLEGPGSPDVAMREAALKMDFSEDGSGVLFHLVLSMLAPERRTGLLERAKKWKASPDNPPADARELWARIIDEITDSETSDGWGHEPRRTRFGWSLRPALSKLAPHRSDASEDDPAHLWRLYLNQKEWEGISEDGYPYDAFSIDHDHEPSGWT